MTNTTVHFTRTDSDQVHTATRTATPEAAADLVAALERLPHIARAWTV